MLIIQPENIGTPANKARGKMAIKQSQLHINFMDCNSKLDNLY
jgi:hypothetical protein